MRYLLVDADNIIEAVSTTPGERPGLRIIKTDSTMDAIDLLGKKIVAKDLKTLKLAVICNWRSQCGISTYSKFLVDALRPKVGEIRIFSEESTDTSLDAADNCVRCWKRGQSMRAAIKAIKDWGCDLVLVQHEFGIFPVATHFLKMIEDLSDLPYAMVLHSVYESHLDKTIMTSAIRHIICHTTDAREALMKNGHDSNGITVIPHGCLILKDTNELWNTFQTPYAIVQFGFGFKYKGVDRAIEAIAHLKKADKKYQDIFYCYLCSMSSHAKHYHSDYYKFLKKKVEDLGVEDNVAIIQKFHPESIVFNYLRTAKLAVFPYVTDQENVVYGATGAARVAIANGCPVILSESHMFDDFEGILPRPKNHLELATEIDKLFSDWKVKKANVEAGQRYIQANNWDVTADRYLDCFDKILNDQEHFV